LELFHTCWSFIFFLSTSISCSNSSSSNCYSPSSLFLTTEIPSSGKLPTTDCIYLFRFSINLLILYNLFTKLPQFVYAYAFEPLWYW
jgi:hypothetical protein